MEPLEDRRLFTSSLISIDTTGLAAANGDASDPDISSSGRYIVFTSSATNLDSKDTSTISDIYWRDLEAGITKLVSVNAAGAAGGNAASLDASVSDDGRFVVFSSTATDLIAGDNNGVSDVFMRDMALDTTRVVSINLLGTGPANGASQQSSISDNGLFVAFSSDATNITANDTSPVRDVFLRDLEGGTTTLISQSTLGLGGDAASQLPSVSASGQYVAFVSLATNLQAGSGAAGNDVYLRDTFAVTTTLMSSTNGLTGGSVDLAAGSPRVSDDGQLVTFVSSASNLVPNDTNGVNDVFRADRNGGVIVLVSQNEAGIVGNGASSFPSMSPNGRFIAFATMSNNLAVNDIAGTIDVYVRDMIGNHTTLVSTDGNGPIVAPSSTQPSMTDDGNLVAFVRSGTPVIDVANPLVGNIFTAPTPFVLNDLTSPVLLVPTQTTVPQPPQVGDTFLPFFVIYDDDIQVDTATLGNFDLIVTGPNGFRETANLFGLVSTTGPSATVSYTVPAPGGDLSSEDNGVYTITVRGNQIGDSSRNFLATGTTGTFTLELPPSETVLPAPTYVGSSPAVGSASYEFSVIYSERGGIDFATFGNDDIQVSGPNGFTQNATFVSSTPLNATQTTVVYRITAPGGTWDGPDAGVYSVNILAGGVRDVANNPVRAGTFGQFVALGADLIAIPLRNLRSGAISGVDQQRARVRILNQGTAATTVPVAVTLYTSTDEILDPADATIGTFIQEHSIPADDFRERRVKFTYPQVPEGNYFIISRVDSTGAVPETNENNNIAASFYRVGLSAPFVDLVPTLVPFSGNRSRLGKNEVIVKIRNAGNVEAVGRTTIALTATSDVTPEPGERPVATIPISLSLRPGQTRTFRLPFTFPIEFERGTYKMVATIDAGNIFPERDEVNNRVVSLSEFTFT